MYGGPMKPESVSEEELRAFQDAYRKDFKEDISIDEARKMLMRLVRFYKLISRPLPTPVEVAYVTGPSPATPRDETTCRSAHEAV